jgi:MFS family permease
MQGTGGPTEQHNFHVVQLDSVAMGVVAAATPFLPVFLTRLGGSNFDVGLLTTLPALGGLLFAIPFGQLLQRRRNVVPWYSGSRLMANMGYGFIAAVAFLGAPAAVPFVLLVWALVTIPSTVGQVAFSVVMDAAARPGSRYDLLSQRWAIMGLTTAVAVAVIGFALERFAFPANYQLAFALFSVAGLASFYYSRQIRVADHQPVPGAKGLVALRQTFALVRSERPFLTFALRQTAYTAGVRLVAPLIPLYYIRVVHASDAWIGLIATAQSLALLVGYWLWRNESHARGGRFVLLWAVGMAALQPALLAGTGSVELIAALAGVAAIFSAGADLALFDELMKRVPTRYGVTFSAFDYAIVNVAGIAAPLIGALLADAVGIQVALLVGAGVSVVAFALFLVDRPKVPVSAR